MVERDIETYLRERVKALGGRAYKFVSPGNDGVPDRLVCLPGGRVAFVETKAPGKKSTPLQSKRQRELMALGGMVFSDVDSKDKVDHVLAVIQYAGGLK